MLCFSLWITKIVQYQRMTARGFRKWHAVKKQKQIIIWVFFWISKKSLRCNSWAGGDEKSELCCLSSSLSFCSWSKNGLCFFVCTALVTNRSWSITIPLKHCDNTSHLLLMESREVGTWNTSWNKEVGKWMYQLCICCVYGALRVVVFPEGKKENSAVKAEHVLSAFSDDRMASPHPRPHQAMRPSGWFCHNPPGPQTWRGTQATFSPCSAHLSRLNTWGSLWGTSHKCWFKGKNKVQHIYRSVFKSA